MRKLGCVVAVLAAIGLPVARPAAGVDLTNVWAVKASFAPLDVAHWTIMQTGSALAIVGGQGLFAGVAAISMTGTIDPTSGAFAASGTAWTGSPAPIPVSFSGTAALAGDAFSGVFDAGFPVSTTGSLCQNGNVDPGEACDNAGLTAFNTCCTDACTVVPDGTRCGGACIVDPSQCVAGRCEGTPRPAGESCSFSGACQDSRCDGAGTCIESPCSECCRDPVSGECSQFFAAPGCTRSVEARNKLVLETGADDARDKLSWVLKKADAVDRAALGDPTTSSDYTFCLYQYDFFEGESFFVAGSRAPAGATCGSRPCWRATDKAVSYRDREATPDGLVKLKVTAGPTGTGRVIVKGKGPNLLRPPGPLPPFGGARVQVRSANACWEATYPSLSISEPGRLVGENGE
jgi:hypothetical protein